MGPPGDEISRVLFTSLSLFGNSTRAISALCARAQWSNVRPLLQPEIVSGAFFKSYGCLMDAVYDEARCGDRLLFTAGAFGTLKFRMRCGELYFTRCGA